MPNVFATQDKKNHSLFIGSSRPGKSVFSERAKMTAKAMGHLVVDTNMFRAGKGLKPYEHEYARRLVHGLNGLLPQSIMGKRSTLISDVSSPTPKGRKWKAKHLVTTANGIVLDRALVRDACTELQFQSGLRLKQPQLIKLMEETGIDETLAEFGEAETQIRERLANALAMKLIGRPWPSYGALQNSASIDETGFAESLVEATKASGYELVS